MSSGVDYYVDLLREYLDDSDINVNLVKSIIEEDIDDN